MVCLPGSLNKVVESPQIGKDWKLVHKVLDPPHKMHAKPAHRGVSVPLIGQLLIPPPKRINFQENKLTTNFYASQAAKSYLQYLF